MTLSWNDSKAPPRGSRSPNDSRLPYEVCGEPYGVNGWGRCELPKGHRSPLHRPVAREEWRAVEGWTDDPRAEQEQVFRGIA